MVANGCNYCSSYNRTFNVKQTAAGSCTWQCSFYDLCPGGFGSQITLRVYKDGDNYHVEVKLKEHVWDKDFGTDQPTCKSLTGLIDQVTNSGTCSSADATCSIVPVAKAGGCACESCSGGRCIDDAVPGRFKVEISGIVGLGGICTGCDLFNGTWILTPTSFDTYGCHWKSAPTSGYVCPRLWDPYVTLSITSSGITVNLLGTSDIYRDPAGTFYRELSDDLDCLSITDYDLPTLTSTLCDLSNATCLITAL